MMRFVQALCLLLPLAVLVACGDDGAHDGDTTGTRTGAGDDSGSDGGDDSGSGAGTGGSSDGGGSTTGDGGSGAGTGSGSGSGRECWDANAETCGYGNADMLTACVEDSGCPSTGTVCEDVGCIYEPCVEGLLMDASECLDAACGDPYDGVIGCLLDCDVSWSTCLTDQNPAACEVVACDGERVVCHEACIMIHLPDDGGDGGTGTGTGDCGACAADNCSDELAACAGDEDCTCAWDCYKDSGDFITCMNDCSFMGSNSAFDDLLLCTNSNCSDSC